MLAWKSDCLSGERWIREFYKAITFSKYHFLPLSTHLACLGCRSIDMVNQLFFNLKKQKTKIFSVVLIRMRVCSWLRSFPPKPKTLDNEEVETLVLRLLQRFLKSLANSTVLGSCF